MDCHYPAFSDSVNDSISIQAVENIYVALKLSSGGYLNMEEEESALRDQALQRIGRNVVNFQRMEKAIKSLIVAGNIRGHASDLAEIHRKRSEQVDKRSMGLLVDEFLSTVYANELPGKDSSPSDHPANEIWMSFSLRVERDEQYISAHREALTFVVRERNELMHQMLWAFDLNSDESCRDLISRLDEQNERLRPHYEWVMQMLGRLRSLQQEILARMDDILFPTGRDSGDAA
jgi:hypothetical protein